MLKRPSRPLPRRFNRPVTARTRSFVERRHRRLREHRQERWKRTFRRWRMATLETIAAGRRWLKFVFIGLAVFAVCLLLFSPILRVREISVIRAEGRVDLRRVLETLAPLYGRHMLLVIVRDVGARVRNVVPDANDVIVSKRYPSRLSVRIIVAPIVARVLIEPVQNSSGGETPAGSGSMQPALPRHRVLGIEMSGIERRRQEFLTEKGLLVASPPPPGTRPLPLVRVVDWSIRPSPGSMLLDPAFLDRLDRAEQALTLEFGQTVRARTVYLRAREFHLETERVGFWFDLRSPLEQQLGRLRTFLKTVKLQDAKEYVDLRLIGRVIYK